MMKGKISLAEFTGGQKDVLNCLFVNGPTWDGNIPSKQARDELINLGLVVRVDGWAWLTEEGVYLCKHADVRDWSDQRWHRKQNGL